MQGRVPGAGEADRDSLSEASRLLQEGLELLAARKAEADEQLARARSEAERMLAEAAVRRAELQAELEVLQAQIETAREELSRLRADISSSESTSTAAVSELVPRWGRPSSMDEAGATVHRRPPRPAWLPRWLRP